MQRMIPSLGLVAASLALYFLAAPSKAQDNGLKTIAASQNAAAAISQLESAIRASGMKVFAKVDHAAAAKEVGLKMPPATVVIFGNPKGGTPNFLKKPTLAIDLTLKMLIWENDTGKTFVTYNSGDYVFGEIFGRHGLKPPAEVAKGQEKMLSGLASAAAK